MAAQDNKGMGWEPQQAMTQASKRQLCRRCASCCSERDVAARERTAYRLGVLDPDIACLNSVSYSQRVRMQFTRDEATRNMISDMRRTLGWIVD